MKQIQPAAVIIIVQLHYVDAVSDSTFSPPIR